MVKKPPTKAKKEKIKDTAGHSSRSGANSTSIQLVSDEQKHSTPHDKFAKSAFKNKEIAIDFFAAHLADKGFSRHKLETFSLSNNEHQRLCMPKIVDDVVYRGEFGERDCYIILEHQSSFDRKIIARLLNYSAALMEEYIEQGRPGQAMVIPVCLYHEPHKNKQPVNKQGHKRKSMLERLYESEQGVESLKQTYPKITVVDLTIVDHEDIGRHGKAAIVEHLLKDIQLPGDAFLQKAKEHLKLAGFDSEDIGSADFRSSILEYILSVYNGDKSLDEVINELCKVMPQEGEIMGKLADKLIAEGVVKGRLEGKLELARNLMNEGVDIDILIEKGHLSPEELESLSSSRAGSPSSLQQMEPSPSHGKLRQMISSSSATEQLSSSIHRRIIDDNLNTNTFLPTDNGPR